MQSSLALLPLLAPLGLAVAALLARRDRASRPRTALGATRAATMLGLVVAALTVVLAALRALLASPLLGHGGLGFSVRIDGLSAVMVALVAVLGAAVVHFSRNYLAGTAARASSSVISRSRSRA